MPLGLNLSRAIPRGAPRELAHPGTGTVCPLLALPARFQLLRIANCRKSSKAHRPANLPKGYTSSERTQRQRSRDTSRCRDENQNHCFVLISHLSGQNGPYDAQATVTLSMGLLNLTHATVCLGSGRPGSTPPSSRNHRRFPGKDTNPVKSLGGLIEIPRRWSIVLRPQRPSEINKEIAHARNPSFARAEVEI